MAYSQVYYEKYSNASRCPTPIYQVGDDVWLDTYNWLTEHPAKKFDQKNAGPFKISQVVSPQAYRLETTRTNIYLQCLPHLAVETSSPRLHVLTRTGRTPPTPSGAGYQVGSH